MFTSDNGVALGRAQAYGQERPVQRRVACSARRAVGRRGEHGLGRKGSRRRQRGRGGHHPERRRRAQRRRRRCEPARGAIVVVGGGGQAVETSAVLRRPNAMAPVRRVFERRRRSCTTSRPAGGSPATQMLVLGLLFAVLAATLDSVWGLAAGAARDWFATSPARLRRVGGAGGLMMIGLGATLALTGRRVTSAGTAGRQRSRSSGLRAPAEASGFGGGLRARRGSAEADPLRQRQLARVVDGVRRPAHVGAPGVRARLAAAAGRLLPAERTADLRARGADVDVDDPAVGAVGGQEQLGLPLVAGEDRSTTAPAGRRCAARSPRPGRGRSARTGSARTSRAGRPRSAPASATSAGADVAGAGARRRPAPRRRRPCRRPPRPAASASRMASKAARECSGPTSVPGVERVADRQRPVGRGHPLDHGVRDRLVHDQPPQRRAPLARGAGGGEDDAAHGEVEVGRRRDDGGVVAAQLEDRPAEAGGHPRRDRGAHPLRSGRADQRDARAVEQRRRRRRRR